MTTAFTSPDQLIRNTQKQTVEVLAQVVTAVLRKADDWLFDQSQKSGEGADPLGAAPRMDALTTLRAQRGAIEKRYRDHFDGLYERLRRRTAGGSVPMNLSLVEESQLDRQMASDLIVEGITRVHGPVLQQLTAGFEKALGLGSLASNDNPLSVQNLGHGLNFAIRDLEFPNALNVVLYKYYERELMERLPGLLPQVVRVFTNAGVSLPDLPQALLRAAAAAPLAADGSVGAAPSPADVAGEDSQAMQMMMNLLRSLRGSGGAGGVGGVFPSELGTRGVGDTRRALGAREVLSMLSGMQKELPPSVNQIVEGSEDPLAQLFKRDLADSARRIGLTPDRVRIAPEEEDSVDLVGMLFDVLFDERHFDSRAKQVVGKLVVPYVKTAMLDRRMFLNRTHPARRFLNAVSEAVDGNAGESPQEIETLGKTEQVVNRLVAEFNEDTAVFEMLETELRGHLAQQAKRSELAERRAAEAQRGQERLEHARGQAQSEVSRRTESRDVPGAVREFLGRAWTHHLSMVALREGAESPQWSQALSVADRLLSLLPGGAQDAQPVASAMLELQPELQTMLSSSGVTGDAARTVIAAIADGIEAQRSGDRARATDASAVLATTPAPPPLPAMPRLRLVAGTDLGSAPADVIEQLQALKVGDWVNVAGEDGRMAPAKLAWVSPISNRLMFVNRRGVRILVASVEELAAMKAMDKLDLRSPGAAFEGAMQSVLGRLQDKQA